MKTRPVPTVELPRYIPLATLLDYCLVSLDYAAYTHLYSFSLI